MNGLLHSLFWGGERGASLERVHTRMSSECHVGVLAQDGKLSCSDLLSC